MELLSQGDNWFIFHLLSSTDLTSVHRANAHFSEDILSSLLNEPIQGQGVFWTSANQRNQRPYPVSIRVLSFNDMYSARDPNNNGGPANTFARQLAQEFEERIGSEAASGPIGEDAVSEPQESTDGDGKVVVDPLKRLQEIAAQAIRSDNEIMEYFKGNGVPWGRLNKVVEKALPIEVDDKQILDLVAKALTDIFGKRGEAWTTYKSGPRNATWVKVSR